MGSSICLVRCEIVNVQNKQLHREVLVYPNLTYDSKWLHREYLVSPNLIYTQGCVESDSEGDAGQWVAEMWRSGGEVWYRH